nr:hypothetical protein [Sicyoidochytrium minutum DNA virus]
MLGTQNRYEGKMDLRESDCEEMDLHTLPNMKYPLMKQNVLPYDEPESDGGDEYSNVPSPRSAATMSEDEAKEIVDRARRYRNPYLVAAIERTADYVEKNCGPGKSPTHTQVLSYMAANFTTFLTPSNLAALGISMCVLGVFHGQLFWALFSVDFFYHWSYAALKASMNEFVCTCQGESQFVIHSEAAAVPPTNFTREMATFARRK